MNVKSHATITYAYDIGNKNIKSVAISNVVSTEIRDVRLSVKKYSDSEYFQPNDIINYTILVSNPGNYPAKSIILKDKLDNTTYINESFKYDFMNMKKSEVSINIQDSLLIFNIEKLESNALCVINYKVKVNDDLNIDDEISQDYSITSNEVREIMLNDASKLRQCYAKIVCEKRSDPFTYVNNDLTYYITLRNIGNIDASNVEVVDQLPRTYEVSNDVDAITIDGQPIKSFTIDNTNLLKILIDTVPANNEEIQIEIKGKIVR